MQYIIVRAFLANHLAQANPVPGTVYLTADPRTLCDHLWDCTSYEVVDLTKVDCMVCTDRANGQMP
jgi:hypothetical protein